MGLDRKDPRINPFRVGIVGVVLLLAGCLALDYLSSPAGETAVVARMQQAARSSGERLDPSATETLARTEIYYRSRMWWKLPAQLVFFAGVMLVVVSVLLWYQQAQQPQSAQEPEEEDSAAADFADEEEEPVV